MLPILRGMEQSKQDWETVAPSEAEGYAAANANAFAVLDAGAKGAGLFATETVPRGTYLFDYSGELLSKIEYDARYPSRVSDYCAALRNPEGRMFFVDARDERQGHPARWMNHNDKKPNVGRRSFFPTDGAGKPRILMYALRDLHSGDELQWDYGDGFWAAHGGKVESD